MAKKEFKYRGKTLRELQEMSLQDLAELFPASIRRVIKRGFTEQEKKLIENLKRSNKVKTHVRDMVILPFMVGKTIGIHNGKDFVYVVITEEMIGHRLGEFSFTRKKLKHSSPGVGATRSSSNVSVR